MLQLTHFPLCPHSRSIRLALGELKLDAELVIEKPWEWRAEFLTLNPAGEVPVLMVNSVLPICGAYAIAEYLDDMQAHAGGAIPPTPHTSSSSSSPLSPPSPANGAPLPASQLPGLALPNPAAALFASGQHLGPSAGAAHSASASAPGSAAASHLRHAGHPAGRHPSGASVAKGNTDTIRLFPGDPETRAEVRRLIDWFHIKCDREVTRPYLHEKYYASLPGQPRHPPNSANLRTMAANVRYHLRYIGFLVDSRRWLAGDELSFADLAAAAHLSALDYLGLVPWEDVPASQMWYMRLKSRPAFQTLLDDYLPGVTPPPYYGDVDF